MDLGSSLFCADVDDDVLAIAEAPIGADFVRGAVEAVGNIADAVGEITVEAPERCLSCC